MKNIYDIAQEYLDLHKDPFYPHPSLTAVFNNIIGGVYGECRCENEKTGLYEIEINSSDSKSGHPVLFMFRDPTD
jgi:hypothetical protein|tara:strand:- start:53 stop:277 length:225 start_codon:yes stop_codon:yes gene_type:complete